MTRTIKASEVKPGMKIRWEYLGIVTECKVGKVRQVQPWGGVNADTPEGGVIFVAAASPVTVLSEPGPEEPTALGARVIADGMPFVRADDNDTPWRHYRARWWVDWRDVCALGEVTIIDADPSWEPPANAPAPTTPSDAAQSQPAPWVTSPATPEPWATWEEVPTLTHVRGKSSAAQYCKAKDGTVSIRGAFSGEWRELPGAPKDMDSRGPFTPAHDTQAGPR
ncbi:hypothetical protein [Kocuria rhizophila]|uniref:hypothetical protein n=1 Tax=Kocuria rhizophila TaxID=72000 RepID=UPI003D6E639F